MIYPHQFERSQLCVCSLTGTFKENCPVFAVTFTNPDIPTTITQ